MAPSEFWQLSTTEFWWEFDQKAAAQKQLQTPLKGKFSSREWQEARKKHKEKMNGTRGASR